MTLLFLALGLLGLVLILIGNPYTVLAGVAVVAMAVFVWAVRSLLRENFGDPEGALTQFCNETGGRISSKGGVRIVKDRVEPGDIVEIDRDGRVVNLSIAVARGSAAGGGTGGGKFLSISTDLTANPALDLRVGRRSLARLLDRYASDAVFHAAETTLLGEKAILVAGKDRGLLLDLLDKDEPLCDALEFLLYETGYDEVRIGSGGMKSLRISKRLVHGDTAGERLDRVVRAVTAVMDRLDRADLVVRTAPPRETRRGVSVGLFLVIAVILVIFFTFLWFLP